MHTYVVTFDHILDNLPFCFIVTMNHCVRTSIYKVPYVSKVI